MASPLPCLGGPLDGHTATPAPGKYTWITGRRLVDWGTLQPQLGQYPVVLGGGGGSSQPRNNCALYERCGAELVYAGHRVYLCGSCGCYHGRCEGGREKRPCALGGDL